MYAMDIDTRKEKIELYKALHRYFGDDPNPSLFSPTSLNAFEDSGTYYLKVKWVLDKLDALDLVLCGGAVTSLFTNQPIKDLDFYAVDPEKLYDAKTWLKSVFKDKEPYESGNAITYGRKSTSGQRVYHVQLITRFTGVPSEVFEYFDFTVTHGAYDFTNGDFVFGPRFFPDIAKRRLVYSGKSLFPICALYRTKKYAARGYTVPGSTMMHIALSIIRLEIKTYGQLKEQLFGIDTMYLQGLLRRDGFKDDLPVDYAYFIREAFAAIDGFDAEDEEEED